MIIKKIKLILIIFLLYQTPLYSKSNSLKDFKSIDLSKYFSGVVAYKNKNNSEALDFFNSSKSLLNKHDPYFKNYLYTLVLENKINNAINLIKTNEGKNNSNFFDAYLLLILDSLKKNDLSKAFFQSKQAIKLAQNDKFNLAIIESLREYIYVFRENKIKEDKKNLGKLSMITETFQRCFLDDHNTDSYFINLTNDPEGDYSRYVYFYLSYLIEKDLIDDAKKITSEIDYINSTLLLSQGKNWIENNDYKKLNKVFSCKNQNDLISEFLFIISNLYSSQDDFEKSNFYLNLSNFLNSKFLFNLSLVAENHYMNEEFIKVKKILKNFKKEDNFYYWYKIKKETQIIAKQRNIKESLNYITSQFNKIEKPNNKILFDYANINRNAKEYKKAIKYYTILLEKIGNNSLTSADILYRRGASFERIGEYEKADQDLLDSLKINPDDEYVLNYLAYSWLERNYRINDAIKMLETAYASKSNDPYIIDSIGWAYFLIKDYLKAEKFLKRALELMPDDPIVNDHYGDILWKLNYKIQARYYWNNVLTMDDADEEMIEKINIKIIKGIESS